VAWAPQTVPATLAWPSPGSLVLHSIVYNMYMELTCTTERLCAEELLAELHREFDRLNQDHFGGSLARPEIILSSRKSYGGYYQTKCHRIVLSWQAYQEHGWDETLNTFRHEAAHAVHPNHSKAFWALAHLFGCTKRHAAPPLIPRTTHKYVYECPNCKHRLLRHRRIIKASCGLCDKKFNPLFALRLVK